MLSKRTLFILGFGAFLIAAQGCSLKPRANATIKISVPPVGRSVYPIEVSGFACIGVNVMAPDIPLSPAVNQTVCTGGNYLGVYSDTVSMSTGGELEVTVPSGAARIVQVFGVGLVNGVCPTALALVGQATEIPYVIGEKSIDLFGDTTVEIESTWNASTPRSLYCMNSLDAKWDSAVWDQDVWAP